MVCEEKSVEYTLTETRLAAPELFTDDALARAAHLSKYYEQHAKRDSFQRTNPPEGPPSRTK
jgi:hypothetical protein